MPADAGRSAAQGTAGGTARWLEVRVSGASRRQEVIDALFSCGSQGVHEADVDIVTHLPAGTSEKEIRDAVVAADPASTVQISESAPVDWSGWRAAVGAHRLGRLTVAPPWLASESDPATTVVIDPAMAFGTGEHATTRGVMRLMQRVIVPGSVIADLGAGSAILSIAAAKLGAASAIAIEIDSDAAGNATENIAANEVADRVHFFVGDAFSLLPLVAPVDVVFANILSSVLVTLLPVIHDSLTPGGYAILSGILLQERDLMLDEIGRGVWRVEAEDSEEEWWSVLISRS
jgi:ribosomal protein L11 methyltransferase